jgi:hypothetical protein
MTQSTTDTSINIQRDADGRVTGYSRTYAIFERLNGITRQVDEREARSGFAAISMYHSETVARGNAWPSWARYTARMVR